MKIQINATVCLGLLLFFTFAIHELFAQKSCTLPKPNFCTRNMNIAEKYAFIKRPKPFLCDTKTEGGGWIVIQRRVHQDTSFQRNWEDYKFGFGSPCTEDYWLGNERVHQLTSRGQYELRIDMTYQKQNYYASYSSFKVDNETNQYRLTLGEFQGNVTNELVNHDTMMFSTPDRDNDLGPNHSCAGQYQAGWWYKLCHMTNLNGHFGINAFGFGVIWYGLTTDYDSLSSVEMKIRKIK
ncbi:ficolin-1-like isoform X1 [Biomphalaria glabrata]|uniref:Ficolin-1-like isoform X1 n=1 Tax=Biomphalaria glabrata TaxID=6526 RepID=A0A9U8E897_BIOGL|nr:ficolin-1-like isoform X1 [Biomphalaria glabrata]